VEDRFAREENERHLYIENIERKIVNNFDQRFKSMESQLSSKFRSQIAEAQEDTLNHVTVELMPDLKKEVSKANTSQMKEVQRTIERNSSESADRFEEISSMIEELRSSQLSI